MAIESVRKVASAAIVKSSDAPEDGPGTWEAILSHPDIDRDGEEVKTAEWMELPSRIPINIDHDMSTAGIVGSAEPFLGDDGGIHIKGTYASTLEGQKIRTLVNEGHVDTMSVEFYRHTETGEKGAEKSVTRELLGGAFTPYPANTKAKILSSKAGARNSAPDAAAIQGIHDSAQGLGAMCGKSMSKNVTTYEEIKHELLYIDVVIAGADYILTFWIDSDGDPVPCDLIESVEEEQAEAPAPADEAAAAVQAMSLDIRQRALLLSLSALTSEE